MLGSVARPRTSSRRRCCACTAQLEAGEEIESPRPTWRPSSPGSRSTSCARPAPAARPTSASGCRSRSSPSGPRTIPAAQAELADSLSLAFLVVLESLTPEQRAAFLLHDVFDYDYERIAGDRRDQRGRTRASSPSRARRHVRGGPAAVRDLARAARAARGQLLRRALEDGDLEGLEALLADDVELHGDGGGKAPALARPISGRDARGRTLVAWSKAAAALRRAYPPRARSTASPGRPCRCRRPADQRDGARDRRRPGPGGPLDRQPGQARPPRAGR